MRLDKYLKVSRVIKRRTLANEVADAGHVGNPCARGHFAERDDAGIAHPLIAHGGGSRIVGWIAVAETLHKKLVPNHRRSPGGR